MAPLISLALMVLAGLGLVLRHDMITVIGFDLGIASAIVGIIGLLVFSTRSESAPQNEDPPRPTTTAQHMAVIGLVAAIVGGYLFSNTFSTWLTSGPTSSIAQSETPASATSIATPPSGRVALRLRRQANGTFLARSQVNGTPLSMTIDTGAVTIVLTADDARRIGVAISDLHYSVPVKTAHGTSFAAQTTLGRVFVGPLGAADIPALVAKPGKLNSSLLGMSFLKRLRSYTVTGNFLTLES